MLFAFQIQPTWFLSRTWFERLGGYPEAPPTIDGDDSDRRYVKRAKIGAEEEESGNVVLGSRSEVDDLVTVLAWTDGPLDASTDAPSLDAAAGTTLDTHLTLLPQPILARHWWQDGSTLDLHADPDATDHVGGVVEPAVEQVEAHDPDDDGPQGAGGKGPAGTA